jgi:ubiquinone/menaquinone biosynthesis C-methylase UbiE
MATPAYHNLELAVAMDPTHANHCLPTLPDRYERVLDVGCGQGQSLVGLGVPPHKGFGVDVDPKAVADSLGYDLRCSRGESLPFPDAYFDFVMSRVALPYMQVPTALREMCRVLRPRGRLWLLLHGKAMFFRRLMSAGRTADCKDLLYLGYVALNSVLLHAGIQVSFLGRYESFQTNYSVRKSLITAGFSRIEIRRERFFVVTAERVQ